MSWTFANQTTESTDQQMNATHRTRRGQPAQPQPRRVIHREAVSKQEFADYYLQIARLLLTYGRTEVARRRLERVVDKFGDTPAAAESRNLLTAIDQTSHVDHPPQVNRTVESR